MPAAGWVRLTQGHPTHLTSIQPHAATSSWAIPALLQAPLQGFAHLKPYGTPRPKTVAAPVSGPNTPNSLQNAFASFEYVKVCSLYGAGFYYVPGTDICLKVGAYFRAEYGYGNIGSSLTNLSATGGDGQQTRLSGPDYNQRARAFIFLDSRQQTAYGTLRAYMNVGFSTDYPAQIGTSALNSTAGAPNVGGLYANRAFIQLAGFTWGLATSYYDFYSSPATSYSVPWSSDTGDGGWKVAAYTAQLGNGVSASLSFEEPRRQIVFNSSVANVAATPVLPVGGLPLQDMNHVRYPDVVANLRVDQAWGSAQIMGAVHGVEGGYYGTTVGGGACTQAVGTGNACNGHPSDKVGFAVGAGIKVNFPMIGPGDYFQAQVNYTEGATRYAALTPSGAGGPGYFGNGAGQGSSLGVGWFSDGVYCGVTAGGGATATCPSGASSINLTTTWSAQAAYEHFWTPALRTSLVGAYTDVSYNAQASAQMCGAMNAGAATVNNIVFAVPANCTSGSMDWSYYSISSRTQWNITKDFYVGLEGYYGHINTMSKGQLVTYTASATGGQPSGLRTLNDQDLFVYRMRVHRDIVP
jgi:hypothetical protein